MPHPLRRFGYASLKSTVPRDIGVAASSFKIFCQLLRTYRRRSGGVPDSGECRTANVCRGVSLSALNSAGVSLSDLLPYLVGRFRLNLPRGKNLVRARDKSAMGVFQKFVRHLQRRLPHADKSPGELVVSIGAFAYNLLHAHTTR